MKRLVYSCLSYIVGFLQHGRLTLGKIGQQISNLVISTIQLL